MWIAAVGYTGLITVLSLWRFIAFNPIPVKNGDKIGHCLAYFGFAAVWFSFYFYSEKTGNDFGKSVLKGACFAFLYGVLMEGAQGLLTSYRMFDYYDVLANTSGIVLAMVLLQMTKNILSVLKSD